VVAGSATSHILVDALRFITTLFRIVLVWFFCFIVCNMAENNTMTRVPML
jgi:hypothetical protein